jgi:prepilin-type N-terminal cleavage/methylation domain-containing protein
MDHKRNAFTLIEVLIVVIIMAVLAATIIPQFSSSTEDAKSGTLEFNLHTIRSQIEMYKVHHLGKLPTVADFADQMTQKTDASGTVDANGAYGPYIQGEIPPNPFNGDNTVVSVATEGTVPSDVVAGGAGWQYDESTGGFYPNNEEWYE